MKINSKSIINLNVKLNDMKLLEDSIGENLGDLLPDNEFLDKTPKT